MKMPQTPAASQLTGNPWHGDSGLAGPRQALALDELGIATAPPRSRQIFVNRDLRLDTIKAVGFDMDYTLARYRRDRLEELAYRLTLEKLVQRGYPQEILQLTYDPTFVIRGLTVDKQLGNILKRDRHDHVSRAFHGRKPLAPQERSLLYRRERLRFVPPRFALVDTMFSLPEMCLYADLVEFFDARQERAVDTWRLFDDTRDCMDEAHRDDTLKPIVRAHLDTYVERDPLLARTLHKLRSAGKKLFLLTNSQWSYTNHLMHFLLDGQLPEYPHWQDYFHALVVGANKPEFFTGDEPLAQLHTQTLAVTRPVTQIKRGHVYQRGNLRDFEKAMHLSGESILYVGDHIYADILRSKKTSLWRTALIVEELEWEIERSGEHQEALGRLAELEKQRRFLDDQVNLQRHHLALLEKTLGAEPAKGAPQYANLRHQRDLAKRQSRETSHEIRRVARAIDAAFNPNWGMVFKEARENSHFGEQVAEYACLYTSRVSNFFYYSSYQYFRSPRDFLPHERE